MDNSQDLPAAHKRIRIGTWNVEYAINKRNSDRLAILRDYPADIWILTETHRSLDLSPTHKPWPSAPRPKVRNVDAGSTWVTIWSRYKRCKQIDVPDPRRQVAAIFETPIGPLAIAGVVLPWHCDKGDTSAVAPPRNWEEHMRVLKEEIPGLLNNLSNGGNCRRVLAGDFNSVLASPGYRAGPEGSDAWNALLSASKLECHTKHIPYLNPPYQKLIDHICSDLGQAQAITTWVGDDRKAPHLSDHPGVVAAFLA